MAKKPKTEDQGDVATAKAPETAAEASAPKAKKEPVIRTVTMDDGRIVEFVGEKKRLLKDSKYTNGRVEVRLDFSNGETRLFTSPEFSGPDFIVKAVCHGLEQKLGDEISGVENIDDAILAIDNLMERMAKGEWNMAKSNDGLAGQSVLLKALVEVSGQTRDQVRQFLAGLSAKEKLALRGDSSIKPTVDRIEAESAKKSATGVDTGALLGKLMPAAA